MIEASEIFKTKTYIEVWESDLSKFVSEFYGLPWRLQQQGDAMGQNTYLKIDVSSEGTDWESPEECEQKLQEWRALPKPEGWEEVMNFERDHQALSVDVVLWDLCRKGIIPEGEYLITVWW